MPRPPRPALALSLMADGATDSAGQVFDAVLGASGEGWDTTWSAIQTSINRNDGDVDDFDPEELPEEPLVHVANYVVVIDEAEVHQDYLDGAGHWYEALTERVERGDATASLGQGASHRTGGLSTKSAITVNDDLLLVLQNAVPFAVR